MIAQADVPTSRVSAVLQLEAIAEPDEALELEEVQELVTFLIDGELTEVRIGQGLSPGTVYVQPIEESELSLGEHRATIQICKEAGETLRYDWAFTILTEEPALPNLPDGFQFVRPLPDSTITLQAYSEDPLVPQHYYPGFADLGGGVCVGVLSYKIVEPGEFLDGVGISGKYGIVALDGESPGDDAVISGGTEAYDGHIYDEQGQSIASYGGPHNYKCWVIGLASGEHRATVELRKASGEVIEYTWTFTITDD